MTTRTEAILFGVAAAVIAAGAILFFRPDPPPSAERQIGAGQEIQRIAAPIVKAAEIRYKTDTIRLAPLEIRYASIRSEMASDAAAGRPTDTLKAKPALATADTTIETEKRARAESDRIADGLRELNRGVTLELVGTRQQRDEYHQRYRKAERGKIVVGVVSFLAGVGTGVIVQTVRKPP